MSWREQAKCKGASADAFFPGRLNRAAYVQDAVETCAGCPVRKACALEALKAAVDGVCGVWAGVDLGDTPVRTGNDRLEPLKELAGPKASQIRVAKRRTHVSEDYVPSDRVVAHLERLWGMGMTNPAIAQAADISLNTFNALIYEGVPEARVQVAGRSICPRDLLTSATEAALLSVPVPTERVPRKRPAKKLVYNPGRCIKCGEAVGSQKDPNWRGVRYGGKGRCERCYQAHRRQQVEAAVS